MTLTETFAALRERGEMALIPYQTAGFPTLTASLENLRRLVALGADAVEFGIPFSDPVADGPTIQYASQEALRNGVTLSSVLNELKTTQIGAPLLLMSYLNPLLRYDSDTLFAGLKTAGATGLIVPDLPVEESDAWVEKARAHGISLVFLLAPTSTETRIRLTAERTDGFIYAVSLAGTTGARDRLSDALPALLDRIRAVTDKPVVVGFGISRPEHIRRLHGRADGVIVASRIIEAIRRDEDWSGLVASLKQATRRRQPCS
jgi:tryptophan synthase alpha chain